MHALFARETASRGGAMAGGNRLMRVVFVYRQQPPHGATPNKHHATAGALAVPSLAFQRREAGGESHAKVGSGRQLGGIDYVMEHIAEDQPASEAGRGQGIVLASFGGHGGVMGGV